MTNQHADYTLDIIVESNQPEETRLHVNKGDTIALGDKDTEPEKVFASPESGKRLIYTFNPEKAFQEQEDGEHLKFQDGTFHLISIPGGLNPVRMDALPSTNGVEPYNLTSELLLRIGNGYLAAGTHIEGGQWFTDNAELGIYGGLNQWPVKKKRRIALNSGTLPMRIEAIMEEFSYHQRIEDMKVLGIGEFEEEYGPIQLAIVPDFTNGSFTGPLRVETSNHRVKVEDGFEERLPEILNRAERNQEKQDLRRKIREQKGKYKLYLRRK